MQVSTILEPISDSTGGLSATNDGQSSHVYNSYAEHVGFLKCTSQLWCPMITVSRVNLVVTQLRQPNTTTPKALEFL